jgi:hypothetical protein
MIIHLKEAEWEGKGEEEGSEIRQQRSLGRWSFGEHLDEQCSK